MYFKGRAHLQQSGCFLKNVLREEDERNLYYAPK